MRLFRTSVIRAIITNRMILRHRLGPPRGLGAALLLGLPGMALAVRPSPSAAQAIGTMQVTARVQPAPAAWPTLAATAELAADAAGTEFAGRLDRGLARLELQRVPADPQRVTIRVDYLRN
jgi:hypothetical protein